MCPLPVIFESVACIAKLCTFFPEVAMSVGTVDIKMVVKPLIFGSFAGFWNFPIFVRFYADDENMRYEF